MTMIHEDFEIEQMDAETYVSLVESDIRYRRPITTPPTAEQLRRLLEEYPDHGRRFRPNDAWLKRLGLSTNLCREVPSLPVEWRESFLATLDADPEFAAAIGRLIGGDQ